MKVLSQITTRPTRRDSARLRSAVHSMQCMDSKLAGSRAANTVPEHEHRMHVKMWSVELG